MYQTVAESGNNKCIIAITLQIIENCIHITIDTHMAAMNTQSVLVLK